jgi:hypothetical protein
MNYKNIKDTMLTISPVNVEYGQNSYADWILTSFLMNKVGSTLFEVRTNGISNVPFKEIEEKLLVKLGQPFFSFETANANSSRIMFFSDQATFFCKLEKGKTTDLSTDYSMMIYSTDKTFADEVIKYLKDQFHEVETDNIYVIASNADGLSLNNLGSLKYNFIRENYEEKVLRGFDYVVSEYNKVNPSGRITIMNGIPGGGKTNLLKGVISSIKNSTVILLPAKFVVELDSPSIVSLLIEERSDRYGSLHSADSKEKNTPILFIIEDADDCLVPRDGANMSTISSLLNYTDGIFGSMLDMRIIATTNADHMDFDKALLRPGRLCRHIVVESLSPEKATEIYYRLGGKGNPYTGKKTLAQVYADVKGDFEDAEIDKKVVGF